MKKSYESNVSSYLPIGVAAGWTTEKDEQELVKVYGEMEDHNENIKEELETTFSNLHVVLDNALAYYGQKQGFPSLVPLKAFNLREKLNWLEEMLFMASTDAGYLSRFGEILSYIHWVDAQRERLLRGYCTRRKQPWLAPLQELADMMANAGIKLEEALYCEHEDYRLPSPYFNHVETEDEEAGAEPGEVEI